MDPLEFSLEEKKIFDHINTAHHGIMVDLKLRNDTSNLHVELASYVHGMQMFVAKHALERIEFQGISCWFDKTTDRSSNG